jgi:3-oxoacyl-[acyl-carrier protein] reductase
VADEPLFVDSGLRDAVVVVSGGSRGIGRAIVELFAAEGADVTFFYREARAAAEEVVARAQGAGRRVAAAAVDVRDREACLRAVEALALAKGRIDVLVNNSGIVRDGILGFLDAADVRDVLATNVEGVFNLSHAVVPHMVARRSGKIVNVSSVAAEKGGRGQTNYAASKGAVNALTRALAVELAPRGITVNAVAPGLVETEMSRDVRERAPQEAARRILLRRFGAPAEVASAVVFLASRHAAYVTGEVLHVDGGFKME